MSRTGDFMIDKMNEDKKNIMDETYIVYVKKTVSVFSVHFWCCNPFEDLVNKNKVIFFDEETCEFVDSLNNVLTVCPYCQADLVYNDITNSQDMV